MGLHRGRYHRDVCFRNERLDREISNQETNALKGVITIKGEEKWVR